MSVELSVDNELSININMLNIDGKKNESETMIIHVPDYDKIYSNFYEKIKYFETLPKYEQKSIEWLDQRYNYLTASTIYTAIGLAGPKSRNNLLLSKIFKTSVGGFCGNIATHWGNKYEPVANMIYSIDNNVKIHEFGMITHHKYPFLGVSPDGICENGKMLEIKCPFSRTIDGKIKPEYYHQMQEQMLVCDFNECDFLECKFIEMSLEEFSGKINSTSMSNTFSVDFGIIISYVNNEDSSNICYLYSDISDNNCLIWHTNKINEILNDNNLLYIQSTFYKNDVCNVQTVKKDPNWIIKYYPILSEFWEEVLYGREHPEKYQPSPPQSPQSALNSPVNTTDVSNDTISSCSLINNKNKVCLI